MQENNQEVSDVEFTETPKAAEPEKFQPAVFLTKALIEAGHPDPTAWMKDIDPRAETAEKEEERIFFANRALRLFLAEIPDRDNISPRMLLADGIDSIKWTALMTQGIVPWLMHQFDEKTGKRIKPEDGAKGATGTPGDKGVEIKEFVGDLDLTEEDKRALRDHFSDGDNWTSIYIGERVFSNVDRNGAACIEWSYKNDLSVAYPLNLMDLYGTPSHLAESTDEATSATNAQEDAGEGDARPSSSEV